MTLPRDTIAVVVGIEEYQVGRAWRLDGPALDACRFARFLTSRGVPANRITLLISPLSENVDAVKEQSQGYSVRAADHATVREVFTQYLPSKTSRLLVLYWGGHGVIEQEERRLFYADATRLDGTVALADRGWRETGPVTAPGTTSVFAGFRFPPEVISIAVRWYLRYGL
ncbi:MAG TPA: hypothetical protein VLW50_19675, partial [Streptosporangiaceae bacterium]|nr:hypothetical protein [Streptosporangiaceae bacterium]